MSEELIIDSINSTRNWGERMFKQLKMGEGARES